MKYKNDFHHKRNIFIGKNHKIIIFLKKKSWLPYIIKAAGHGGTPSLVLIKSKKWTICSISNFYYIHFAEKCLWEKIKNKFLVSFPYVKSFVMNAYTEPIHHIEGELILAYCHAWREEPNLLYFIYAIILCIV